ncbi:hypothetical protein LEP1GSC165_2643 [Leptospira santarosai str. CBC523]|nr:hypothetical protein LEP1GSC165_2643 [Leptospira santarosai str. CBC523]
MRHSYTKTECGSSHNFKSQDGVSIVDSKPETKSIPIIRWL